MSGPPQPCVVQGPADELVLFPELKRSSTNNGVSGSGAVRRCVGEAAVNYCRRLNYFLSAGNLFARQGTGRVPPEVTALPAILLFSTFPVKR